MSTYKRPGHKNYTIDFTMNGVPYKKSSGTTNKKLADEIERKWKQEIIENRAGIVRAKEPNLLSEELKDFMEQREEAKRLRTLSKSTYNQEVFLARHIEKAFGKVRVTEIDGRAIRRYQLTRLELDEAAPKSINLECGLLRSVLIRCDEWHRIKKDFKMLPTDDTVGQVLEDYQEQKLIDACNASRSPLILTFVLVALYTGGRFSAIRNLQWKSIDFRRETLTWGDDKTEAGSGRVIPLNSAALDVLKEWAEMFPHRKGRDFIFPSRVAVAEEGMTISEVKFYWNPSEPVSELKTSWNGVREKSGVDIRFHDLRHTFVTRMLERGCPLAVVARIVGWSPSTMAKMAKRYAHFSVETMRVNMELAVRQGPSEKQA